MSYHDSARPRRFANNGLGNLSIAEVEAKYGTPGAAPGSISYPPGNPATAQPRIDDMHRQYGGGMPRIGAAPTGPEDVIPYGTPPSPVSDPGTPAAADPMAFLRGIAAPAPSSGGVPQPPGNAMQRWQIGGMPRPMWNPATSHTSLDDRPEPPPGPEYGMSSQRRFFNQNNRRIDARPNVSQNERMPSGGHTMDQWRKLFPNQ